MTMHKQHSTSLNEEQNKDKLVIAMFTRMVSLFGHKWQTKEGSYLNEHGDDFSINFKLWRRKTDCLTDKQWARGFDQLEYKVTQAARNGDEVWPPSYAEFIGYCSEPTGAIAHKPFYPNGLQLEDKTAKEKRKKEGVKNCAKLKSLFD